LLANTDAYTAVQADIYRFIDRFVELCKAISVLGEISPRASDAIGGMGEQMSVRILAAYLAHSGTPAIAIDATELIVTDDVFTSATPLIAQTNHKTSARLLPLLKERIIPIVTGFIAAAEDGATTTLGRGGSDYSASIIGRAVNAREVWIWTDVDGVMTTDPRVAPDARSIPFLTYNEISELAYYGAKVLHPRTMRPVMESAIPLRIKNTFNPDHPGSVIVANGVADERGIKAVTAIRALSLVTVEGRGMMGVPGVAARTFKAVAETRASVLMITQSSSEQSICFVLPEEAVEKVIDSLNREFKGELGHRDIEKIWSLEPVAIITTVGAGMRGMPGIAGRLFTALGEAEVNIVAIAQGSSECSISVVVESEHMTTAVRKIHDLIVQ
jgi:aspartate kinase